MDLISLIVWQRKLKNITKIHENFFRGTPKEIKQFLLKNEDLIKGEFVILIKVNNKKESFILVDKIYHELSSKLSLKDLAKAASEITGINKNKIYKRFLSFSNNSWYYMFLSWSSYRLIFIKRKVRTSKSKVPVNNWGTWVYG